MQSRSPRAFAEPALRAYFVAPTTRCGGPHGEACSDRIDAAPEIDPMNRVATSIMTNGMKPFDPVRGTTDLVRENQTAVRDGVSFCRSD